MVSCHGSTSDPSIIITRCAASRCSPRAEELSCRTAVLTLCALLVCRLLCRSLPSTSIPAATSSLSCSLSFLSLSVVPHLCHPAPAAAAATLHRRTAEHWTSPTPSPPARHGGHYVVGEHQQADGRTLVGQQDGAPVLLRLSDPQPRLPHPYPPAPPPSASRAAQCCGILHVGIVVIRLPLLLLTPQRLRQRRRHCGELAGSGCCTSPYGGCSGGDRELESSR